MSSQKISAGADRLLSIAVGNLEAIQHRSINGNPTMEQEFDLIAAILVDLCKLEPRAELQALLQHVEKMKRQSKLVWEQAVVLSEMSRDLVRLLRTIREQVPR